MGKIDFKEVRNILPGFLMTSLFLSLNLLNIYDYGITWDEPDQLAIAEATIKLIKNGKSGGFYRDLIYYGPFFETLKMLFSIFFRRLFNLQKIVSMHIFPVIFGSLGILSTYLIGYKFFNKKTGLFSSLFLSLFPRFISNVHYNSKDIPLAIITTFVIFFFYMTLKRKKIKYAIFTGIFIGAGICTRISFLIVVPILAFSYFIYLTRYFTLNKEGKIDFLKREFYIILIIGITTTISIVLFWPTIIHNPMIFIDSFKYFLKHGWGGALIYMGKRYHGWNLPWHYAPVYLGITTPLITIFFIFIGVFSIKNILRKKIIEISIVILWIFLPLLIWMYPKTVKYDGMRHFFLVIPALSLLAGLGASYLSNKIGRKGIFIITPFIISILVLGIIEIHPHEGSYFNIILRLIIPSHIENYFDIEYWGSSYRQGVNWLNKNADLNSRIEVRVAPHLIYWYELRPDLYADWKSRYPKETVYVMFITRWNYIDENVLKKLKPLEPIHKISIYNSDILYIYRIKNGFYDEIN